MKSNEIVIFSAFGFVRKVIDYHWHILTSDNI